MTGLEGAGIAGELLSWIGLVLGVPLLLVGSALGPTLRLNGLVGFAVSIMESVFGGDPAVALSGGQRPAVARPS